MSKQTSRPQCEQLEDRSLPSVSIHFNYSLDTKGFFNDSNRRALLERAARMITSRLSDTLDAIVPSGGNTWTPSVIHPATGKMHNLAKNKSVPANTIIIYVGARDLPGGQVGLGGTASFDAFGSQDWLNQVWSRGEPGALPTVNTDFAPSFGSLTFDTTGTTWHFGTTTAGLTSSKTDFMSVALHELGHVLGLGTAPSWDRLTSTGSFRGASARALNGGRNVPLDSSRHHFAEGTRNPNGVESAIDPSLNRGTRKFLGALDFAALDDIGWEIRTSDDSLYRSQDTGRSTTVGLAAAATSFFASIENQKDVDIYRIHVGSGRRINVTVGPGAAGSTQVDTYLRIYDANGKVLATGNQGGRGGTDRISLSVPASDYYFIAVSSSANRDYDPFAPKSGPGGPLGGYKFSLSFG